MPASGAPPGEPAQSWKDNDGRLVATGGVRDASCWMHWPRLATFWFESAGAVRAVPLAAGRDQDIRDAFVRGVVPVVLLWRGWEALHASAVLVDDDRLVAFCAVSGTGKSTLAVALTACGARHFADDTVVYRLQDQQPIALRLAAPIRVDSRVEGVVAMSDDKIARVPPGTAAPLRRVYVLHRDATIDPEEPRFSPVPPSRRFEMLLTHSHPLELGPESRYRSYIGDLLDLSRAVDVWQCAFRPELNALSILAERVLAHARS